MNLGVPQIIYMALLFLGLGVSLSKHGKPETGTHNFWVSLLSTVITITILWWGGFFW